MKRRSWAYNMILVYLLLNSALLVACATTEQGQPMQSTPIQQMLPEKDKSTTSAASSGSTADSKPEAIPGPTMMQARPSPTATARPAPVDVPGAAPGEAIITVTGQVWDVASSARVIDLVEQVHGIDSVAVGDKTEITSADGKQVGLNDIKPGMVIQASGQADGNGAVLANTIRIITGASPIPTARPTPS
ncbi:MAG: hypothetical protein ACOX87_03620 [Chloroflexota bacterium]